MGLVRGAVRSAGRWLVGAAGVAVAAYAVVAAVAWARFGRVAPAAAGGRDSLLDRFMPEYEVVDRHGVAVGAPADVTFAVATNLALLDLPVVRAIIRGREVMLGATRDDDRPDRPRPKGLVAETLALGWGMLAEVPGREIVVGAVTKPWEADVVFRAVPPDEFAAFDEPGYAKIVWTLRADPDGPAASIFRTETRVMTTDEVSRATFRRYWAVFSPGIRLIRRVALRPIKDEAERRARER